MTDDALPAGRTIDPGAYEALPWHADAWQRLTAARTRLPHALLLQGQEGLGKRVFALRLARWLLCTHVDASGACGRCHGCALFDAGHHPDLLRVTLEEERTAITVDQIRGLADFISLKPHSASHKAVLIAPADLMNLNAANALLKLLEEPPLGSIFILASSRPARLPATIRSRCVPVVFRPPAAKIAQDWLAHRLGHADTGLLAAAGGAPLRAQQLADPTAQAVTAEVRRDVDALAGGTGDPIRIAARWKNLGTKGTLDAARCYLAEQIRTEAVADAGKIYSRKFKELLTFLKDLDYAYNDVGTPIDESLLLEQTLIRWSDQQSQPVYTVR